MAKLSNDDKIKNVQIRKILKGFVIFFALLTITLALLSLFENISPIFSCITFIIEVILSRTYEKLNPKEEKQEEVKKAKTKKKKEK